MSAEGASENFRVFGGTAAYDVIFSNSTGGGACVHLHLHTDFAYMYIICNIDSNPNTMQTDTYTYFAFVTPRPQDTVLHLNSITYTSNHTQRTSP